MLRLFLVGFAFLAFANSSYAQETNNEKKIKLNSNKRIFLEYDSNAWNKDPNTVDTGALILRDGITKKMARIELFETDMDTGLFRGQYMLNWGDAEMAPEVYLAPAGTGKTAEQLVKIGVNIDNGTLLRKPFFVRSNNKAFQTLTVFDNKEQAIKAYENYVSLYNTTTVKKPVDPAALEAQAHENKMLEAKAQKEKEIQQAQSRASIEEQEKKNREALKAQQALLSEQEQAAKKAQAKALADEAFALYKKSKFKEAEEKFSKATELDPENNSFYFQYGVTLYKNEKYDKAIALLKIGEGSDVNEIERQYYLGLCYMKKKEYDPALAELSAVRAYQDKNLSPSAGFYAGIINYQKENYEAAKSDFEYVLDSSSDPSMDKQAETYIEQIANIMAFKKEQEKKFILTLNAGLMYDSNILLTQNSIAGSGGSPSDLAGYRWSYGGSLEYRPIYEYTREFSIILSVSDLYSTDNKFAAKKTFQDTDPLVIGISAPYKIKTTAFGKAYQGSFTPGFETTAMNVDTVGSRETIINSTYLRNDNTFVMSNDLFSTYSLEYRINKSLLTSSGSDDQNGTKYTLSTNQTLFKDSKKTTAWIGDLGYSMNNAVGDDYRFTRYDLGISYMSPAFWEAVWTGKLGYYNEMYPKHTTGRNDKNTSLMMSLSKPLAPKLTGSLTGIYTINSSTLESSDYRKYLIMTNLSWSTSL